MEIILVEPEIPQNAGNIIRTCAATKSSLVLVRPLGFTLSDKQMRRAGLDYIQHTQIQIIDDLDSYLLEKKSPFYFFSTKGQKLYSEIQFEKDALLIFGSESKGLAPWIHEKYGDRFCTIPMAQDIRSLNVSNSVAIALYEGLRQQGFATL